MSHRHYNRAFTLIELLVVVVIIGMLSTLLTSAYIRGQVRARDNVRKSNVQAIATAVESYYAVKKSFPGKSYDTAKSPAASLKNCENKDTTNDDTVGNHTALINNYVYYYFPLTAGADSGGVTKEACDKREAANYDKGEYYPFPSWIPGLSDYLNPFPADENYKGSDGSSKGTYKTMELKTVSGVANQTSTYVYRHLDGGYAVYARLEKDDADSNITDSIPASSTPNLGGDTKWTITTPGIYMIRK